MSVECQCRRRRQSVSHLYYFLQEMLIRSTINTTPNNNNNKTWILGMPFLCFFLLVSLDLSRWSVRNGFSCSITLLIYTRNMYRMSLPLANLVFGTVHELEELFVWSESKHSLYSDFSSNWHRIIPHIMWKSACIK